MNDKSKPCTPVAQHPSLKSCFSACLESFLTDNEQPVTQLEMVSQGKAQNLCDNEGVVPDANMKAFCALRNIEFERIKFEDIPSETKDREGFLLGCWNYEGEKHKQHCVRFCRHI